MVLGGNVRLPAGTLLPVASNENVGLPVVVDRQHLRGGEGVDRNLIIDLVDDGVRKADLARPDLVRLVPQRVLLADSRAGCRCEIRRLHRAQRRRDEQLVGERSEDQRAGRERFDVELVCQASSTWPRTHRRPRAGRAPRETDDPPLVRRPARHRLRQRPPTSTACGGTPRPAPPVARTSPAPGTTPAPGTSLVPRTQHSPVP